jgi:hypothetical protein
MDNEALSDLLRNTGGRQFWIVLWGYPEHSPEDDVQVFDEPIYDHGLARKPEAMKVGDILFVHRIHISKIIFVGEVIEAPRKSMAAESEKEAWRKRWTWSIQLKNLTPTYGVHWRRWAEKTFPLKDRYNELNPQNQVSIGRLQHGLHVQIPERFARFLLEEIISLGSDKDSSIPLTAVNASPAAAVHTSQFERRTAADQSLPTPVMPLKPMAPGPTPTVSAAELAEWRRKLVRLLVGLEKNSEASERTGVAERIGRLQRSGTIPREIGAMMRTITEMRNATEYQAKTLSAAENSAVKAAWVALQEWARGRGLDSLT